MGAVLGTLIWLHEEEEEEEEQQRRREEQQRLQQEHEQTQLQRKLAAQRRAVGPHRRSHTKETTRRRLYPANRVYRPRVTFLELSEEECLRRLRFSKQVVSDLCNLLQQDLMPAGPGGHALPVAVKVTTALNFFASGSFQGATGDISHISQSAVHKCIKQVTNALFARANDYICFPMDASSQNDRAMGFAAVAGFPRVQGVIDCTHIAIKAPDNQPAAFNRKGYYSINVQLVTDHLHRIMQVCARFPGSCHDAFILHQSTIPPLFHSCQNFKGWLIGDKDYPLHTWLMTPLPNPRTPAELRYNESHGTTRRVIKHTIGLLKQRFRCLDRSGGPLQYSPQRVSRIVVVCCILHNLAVQRGLHLEEEVPEVLSSSDEEDLDESEEGMEEGDESQQLIARDVRNQFITQCFG
ncbi:putative nuclease HARBI1 [Carcharodon carcharias]|uniref:putative nuclease HARBI1 n=1 Tax=Carcharodon carcharias TaxID=13397 RepID=UPI001B7F29E2|nr:putative nuclease HARBI1 [Carcharodon carcharias]